MGRIFFDTLLIIPAFVAISISPTQKDMTPIMVMHSVIASLDESMAAFVTSGIFPVQAANMMPTSIIPAHR